MSVKRVLSEREEDYRRKLDEKDIELTRLKAEFTNVNSKYKYSVEKVDS